MVSVNDGRISIYLQENTNEVTLGDDVDVKISAVLNRGVILAPKSVIFEENGVKKINILENNHKKTITILTGLERNDQIEILEGISDGEVLIE